MSVKNSYHAGIIEAAGNAIDKLVTSDEERDSNAKLGFFNTST